MPESAPLVIGAVAVVYAVAAKVSFLVTIPPGNVSPVFPSAGIALAAAMIFGRRALVGVWLGSFAANLLSFYDGTVASIHAPSLNLLIAACIGLGAMSSAAAGARLVPCCCKGEHPLHSGWCVLMLTTVGALGCCVLSSTVGVLSLSLGGYISWERSGYSWLTWWAGDAAGAIIAAPLILAWHHPHLFRRSAWRILEATVLGGVTFLFCHLVFFGNVPFAYGIMPILLWAAFRFGMRGASTAAAVVALYATIGTSQGRGPFVGSTMNESLLSLHSFLDVTIMCALFLAGVLAERKRAEVEISRSQARLQAIFENAGVAICVTDSRGGRYLASNPRLAQFLGYEPEEILAHSPLDFTHPDDQEATRRNIDALLSSAVPSFLIEKRYIRKDGQIVWGLTSVVSIRDHQGGIQNLIAVIADITSQKRIEEELRVTQASLEERVLLRTTELAVARDRAEDADRLKSAFLATMSHELRTPLNSIIGFTGIILQGLAGPLNPEQTKQLGMVQNSARHLLALINDVLDISKIEAGQVEIHPEPFDLRASIEKVMALVRPLAAKKGLSLSAKLPAEMNAVVSDRMRIEQVLINLLNNAVKFTEKGGVSLVAGIVPDFKFARQASPQPAVLLQVTDTGMGIKPEDLAKLFLPFRQIDCGLTREHEGTGLGLAICRRLAGLLGGEISVNSEWGKGSTFAFVFPVNRQVAS